MAALAVAGEVARISGLKFIKSHSLSGIKALLPPLITIKLYHDLHKKHLKVLPRIVESLEAIDKISRIRILRTEYVASLQRPN